MAYQFILPEAVSDFHDYFKLNVPIEEIAQALGYTHQRQNLTLPKSGEVLVWEADLAVRLEATLPIVSFNSEMARREFLIAPVLLEVARHVQAKIRAEYPLTISNQLRGSLDYLVLGEAGFLVVDAKNADMERGLSQLLAELAALDKWTSGEETFLYGAVSVGDFWKFCVLDRAAKTVTADLNFFLVPRDLSDLLRILVAILRGQAVL